MVRFQRAVDLVIICNRATQRTRADIKHARQLGRTVDTRLDEDDLVTSAVLIAAEEGNLTSLNQLAAVHRLSPNSANKVRTTDN